MSDLLGSSIIKKNAKSGEVLTNACPVCGDDMILKGFEKYFTVLDKPILKIANIDTFYQCDACQSSYNTKLKDIIALDDIKKEIEFQDAGKLYAKALIASMTHMATIDGELDEQEQQLLHGIIGKYSNIADELIESMDYVKENGNKNDYVFIQLRKVRKVLSAESVLSLLAEAFQMIIADGKMKKEELLLLNVFLLESGLPKSLYKMLLLEMKKP